MPIYFSEKRIRPGPADVTHAGTRFHPSFLTSLSALWLKNKGQMGTMEPGMQRLASRAFSPPLCAAPQSPLSPLSQGQVTHSILHLWPPTSGRSQASGPSSLFVKDQGSSGLWESQKSRQPSQILRHLLFFFLKSQFLESCCFLRNLAFV